MGMEIDMVKAGGVNIVKLQGRLDIMMSAELEQKMKDLLDSGADRILVDLGRLEFLSSSGLRIFIDCAKKIRNVKGKLAFCRPSPSVMNVFRITRLDSVFEIHDSAEAAMSALNA